MKVRTFMPLAAAALIAVLVLALGAGTGAAKSDVQAAPAKYKVALVTDIGGLDDRSFNFLANKGLKRREEEARRRGHGLHLEVRRDYVPNLTRAARNGERARDRRRLPDGRRGRAGRQALPEDEVRDHRQQRCRGELKGKPTNVRGILFKEQEAGYLVGFLAAKQIVAQPYERPDEARGGRRAQDPAGGPLHRGLLRGCEAGQREGEGHALLLAGLRRPGEVQGRRAPTSAPPTRS